MNQEDKEQLFALLTNAISNGMLTIYDKESQSWKVVELHQLTISDNGFIIRHSSAG